MRRRHTSFVFGALAVGASLAIACSDSAKPAPAGSVTHPPEDASIDRQVSDPVDAGADVNRVDGAVVCSVPAFGGGIITGHFIQGIPPTDTGGAITAGTYDLTDLEIYVEDDSDVDDAGAGADGGSAPTAQATFVIAGTTIKLSKSASPVGGGAPNVTMSIANQHVNDVFLVTDETCPTNDSAQTPFSATTTTIALHTGQLRREIYTRRP